MRSAKGKTVCKIVIFVMLCLLMVVGLNALIEPATPEPWLTLPYIYEHSDVNTVFVGSSLMYNASIPLAVDEGSGLNSLNLGSPAQTMMSSYFLLKEALSYNSIRHVILYIDITRLQSRASDNHYHIHAIESMKLSVNKLDFMVHAFPIDKYPDALLRCYQLRGTMQEWLLFKEPAKARKPINYPDEIVPYLGKGYIYSSKEQKRGEVAIHGIECFDTKQIKVENTQYLHQIIELCKSNQIDLIIMCSPRIAANVLATGNYDVFHDYVKSMADANDLQFWDFVYVRPECLTIDDTMFWDDRHANYRLALPFSKLVGQMLREHIDGTLDVDRYLFSDYSGFLSANQRVAALTIGGLSAQKTVKANAIMDKALEAEYRFLLSNEKDGVYTVIQDWSTNSRVDVSGQPKQQVWLLAEARKAGKTGEAEQRAYMQIDLR
jgi:hypothetical protein